MSLVITHNAGFFSCCSVKLNVIVDYINSNKKLPDVVDSSTQFKLYKTDTDKDVTYDYFENPNNLNDLEFNEYSKIDYKHSHQFNNYLNLDFKNLCPIVKKYFSPSNHIVDIIKHIEDKYNLDYNNICVLFYRGNDKIKETKICEYDDYMEYANVIINKNPNIQFLIQSDETEFIELMTKTFPNNSFYFKDEIRHMNKCNSSVDIVMKEKNVMFSKFYLAITIIMSKCEYIICGSGNCSIWIILYRGNSKNIYQNLNKKWFINRKWTDGDAMN
jgi:hypothetical protein